MADPLLLNLFLAIGTLTMLTFLLSLIIVMYYLVRFLKGLRILADAAKEEAQALHEDLEAARRLAHKAGSFVAHLLPAEKRKRRKAS